MLVTPRRNLGHPVVGDMRAGPQTRLGQTACTQPQVDRAAPSPKEHRPICPVSKTHLQRPTRSPLSRATNKGLGPASEYEHDHRREPEDAGPPRQPQRTPTATTAKSSHNHQPCPLDNRSSIWATLSLRSPPIPMPPAIDKGQCTPLSDGDLRSGTGGAATGNGSGPDRAEASEPRSSILDGNRWPRATRPPKEEVDRRRVRPEPVWRLPELDNGGVMCPRKQRAPRCLRDCC